MSIFGYENKVKYPIYVSKNVVKINKHLLLIAEGEKKHNAFFTDFSTLMYDHTLHLGKNIFVFIVCKFLEQQKN